MSGLWSYLWDWVNYMFYLPWGKSYKLLMIGLDNAGKTSCLERLRSGRMTNPSPSFQPNAEDVVVGNLTARIHDVGGHERQRRLWKEYAIEIHGLVFMVDSSDRERISEAKEELSKVLKEENNIPVLVFANKQDLPRAMKEDELRRELGLQITSGKSATKTTTGRPVELFLGSVLQEKGLMEGFSWLHTQI